MIGFGSLMALGRMGGTLFQVKASLPKDSKDPKMFPYLSRCLKVAKFARVHGSTKVTTTGKSSSSVSMSQSTSDVDSVSNEVNLSTRPA